MWSRNCLAKSMSIALLCGGVAACDGDVRLLEEQVEAIDLDLESIAILPPINALDPLFISSDQELQLLLTGRTFAGNIVTVSPDDRRWSSSDSSVLSVNEDGVVVGQGEGTATVSVLVSNVAAMEPLTITVSDAPLLGISEIISSADVSGVFNDTLDPCLPVRYTAIGDFGANDQRALSNVVWGVDALSSSAGAEVFTDSASLEGTTILVGRTPSDGGATVGPITLTATTVVGEDSEEPTFTRSVDLIVADSLTSLSVLPEDASLFVGTEIQLTAPATYSSTINQFATNGVEWNVTAGSLVASVEGVGDNSGLVTGMVAGTASVTATCGAFSESALITVTGLLNGLSFNFSADLVLDLEDGDFDDLAVSQGSASSM